MREGDDASKKRHWLFSSTVSNSRTDLTEVQMQVVFQCSTKLGASSVNPVTRLPLPIYKLHPFPESMVSASLCACTGASPSIQPIRPRADQPSRVPPPQMCSARARLEREEARVARSDGEARAARVSFSQLRRLRKSRDPAHDGS